MRSSVLSLIGAGILLSLGLSACSTRESVAISGAQLGAASLPPPPSLAYESPAPATQPMIVDTYKRTRYFVVYPPITPEVSSEAYAEIDERGFTSVASAPLSTFSIDVDTGAYSNLRRMIENAQQPPADAVRIEEMVNYFDYDYAPPNGETPFAVHVDTAKCPWATEHLLMRVGLKGRVMDDASRPDANLVFLIDVSGSMQAYNKLPLVKSALKLLVQRLTDEDRVAIVTYAGSAGVALPSTRVTEKNRNKILEAIENLESGGSTHGSAGIRRAYEVAEKEFRKNDVNRVILATDGDFNVGVTSLDDLLALIEKKADTGVFLNVLGFGMGNLKDETVEQLADHGNGMYAYIDSMTEARKVFVHQMVANLVTIAKDVKIQVEFNPAAVAGYRLLGYENRALAAEDFKDDTKDAGEVGAGHTVTALYEVVPAGVALPGTQVDDLRYQSQEVNPDFAHELALVKLRYKLPDEDESTPLDLPVTRVAEYGEPAGDFGFASGVALFGMLLRESPHAGSGDYEEVLRLAQAGRGTDEFGYRAEFMELVRAARDLWGKPQEK